MAWFPSKKKQQPCVKSFNTCQEEENAYDAVERGKKSVPVDRIVGSVGRYQDFDEQFHFKEHVPKERLEKIKHLMRTGKTLPPVKLYQIKDDFYVVDGNHRIAAAKEMGHDEILAEIVEFIPSKLSLENVRYREKLAFQEESGLTVPIELTEIGQYSTLLTQIGAHQQFIIQNSQSVDFMAAAKDWHQTIYLPLISVIQKSDLLSAFPKRTMADLYIYITHHQWDKKNQERHYGVGINQMIPTDMETFREKMAEVQNVDYPEMTHTITVFVTMNVSPKHEEKIIDKLFELDEVKEIHSIHGNVDLLVKVELTRTLLSSDAGTISTFVHEQFRQLTGIISTQTLIPGFSKFKP